MPLIRSFDYLSSKSILVGVEARHPSEQINIRNHTLAWLSKILALEAEGCGEGEVAPIEDIS